MKRKTLLSLFLLSTLCGLTSCDLSFSFVTNSSSASSSESESLTSSESGTISSSEETTNISSSVSSSDTDDISFHFFPLGNASSGDSTYIKAGDTDILIDAGSTQSSASSIISYVKRFCNDNTLEYVIATHAHEDHIAAFAPQTDENGVLSNFEVENIIDFGDQHETNSKTYQRYAAKRDALIAAGTKYYAANDLFDANHAGVNNVFTVGNNLSFEVLYQEYYDKSTSNENDYSVCLLFNQNDEKYFLFTGDLEEDGEKSLVDSYFDTHGKDLPHVELFKAGHHGSYTASSSYLLNKITPEICVVNCCAGTSEYTSNVNNQFPSQDFINRIAPHTSKVYIPTQVSNNPDEKYQLMNGEIVLSYLGNGEENFTFSNNSTKLKDTEWFNSTCEVDGEPVKMRVWPNVTSTYN